MPPPPSPPGNGKSRSITGVRPPSYHVMTTGGIEARAANSYRVIIARGYDPGLLAGAPHGVDDDVMAVGSPRLSAQNGWSSRCAPMSPMALTPKSTQPRQLKG